MSCPALVAGSRELLPCIGHGWISVKPDIARLEGEAIIFVDGTRERVDAIIYATGYRASFASLAPRDLPDRWRQLAGAR